MCALAVELLDLAGSGCTSYQPPIHQILAAKPEPLDRSTVAGVTAGQEENPGGFKLPALQHCTHDPAIDVGRRWADFADVVDVDLVAAFQQLQGCFAGAVQVRCAVLFE